MASSPTSRPTPASCRRCTSEGRQAVARELPGAAGHVRRAEGARRRLPGAREGSASPSRSRDGERWPTRRKRRATPVADARSPTIVRCRAGSCRGVCRPGSWRGSPSGMLAHHVARRADPDAAGPSRPAASAGGAGARTPTACVTTRNACARWRHRRSAKPKPRRARRRQRRSGLPRAARVRRAEDPLAADRRRREYESLFASNVVLEPPAGGRAPGRRS